VIDLKAETVRRAIIESVDEAAKKNDPRRE
jgi:hypothetical protein